MDCRRFSQKLADAALEPGELRDAGLAAHLEICAACRQELEAQRRLAQAMALGLAAAVSAEPPPSFAAGVRARLASEPTPLTSWFAGWVPVAAGALAVLVLMVIWFARQEGQEPVPGPRQEVSKEAAHQPVIVPDEAHVAAARGEMPVRQNRELRPKGAPAVRAARIREPEVIVPPGQREAILRFYAAVLSGRTDASWALEEMKPLKVAELKILPLEPVTSETRSPESENSNGLLF